MKRSRLQTGLFAFAVANVMVFTGMWFRFAALPGFDDIASMFFTHPRSFELVDATNNVFADSHCTMSTLNSDAWKTALCSFRNLCYDPKLQRFVLYTYDDAQEEEDVGVNLGNGEKLSPLIVRGKSLPSPRYQASESEVWVVAALSKQSNTVEHYLRDNLFAWWFAAKNSIWPKSAKIRTLLLSSRNNKPVLKWQQAWYETLFPNTALSLISSIESLQHPTCFPQSVVGLGSMTDHCMANEDHLFYKEVHPALEVYVQSIPCTIGRISMFAEIRKEMISSSHPSDYDDDEMSIDVLFTEEDTRSVAAELSKAHPNLEIVTIPPSEMSPREQIRLGTNVLVLVTKPDGPNSVLAHFLGPRTSIVLFDPTRRRENHMYWNHLGYARVTWTDSLHEVAQAVEVEAQRQKKAHYNFDISK